MFYYSENTNKFIDNRVDAFLYPEPCYFYYYDKELSKIDWTFEPQETLQELYRNRAEQIRSRYEYIILCYSGGHDSSNVLETFYYNNIHIDEILLVGAFSQDSYTGSDENHNGEIYHQAIPTLKKLNLPNTKISQVDYTIFFNDINNFSLIKNYGSDWSKHIGYYYSPHNLFWNNLKNFIGQNNDKKTGVIFGIEKPNFQYSKNRAYTYFTDGAFTQYGNFQKDQNFDRINFYIDPNFIDISRKQLHIIYRFFVKNCLIEKTLSIPDFFKNYEKIIHRLIYDLKNPIVFRSTKSPKNVLSLRDRYLLKNKNSDIYKIYIDGIKKNKVIDLNIQQGDLNLFKTRKYYL